MKAKILIMRCIIWDRQIFLDDCQRSHGSNLLSPVGVGMMLQPLSTKKQDTNFDAPLCDAWFSAGELFW